MKTVLISGANGFIATNFMIRFAKKYNFVQLSHTPQAGHITLEQLAADKNLLKSIDSVINLAGANIGTKRWSICRRNELLVSRIKTTLQLTVLFNQVGARAHFISASAVGIYPPNQENDEETAINYHEYNNFSQQLTRQWENTARTYKGKLTITRFGVVLNGYGGAFPKMLKPFLFYIGGPLGRGLQHFPWIALVDLLNAIDYILEFGRSGIYNLVAPQIISNNELIKQISTLWHRPHRLRISESMVHLIFGQMGQELFLNNLDVMPKRLWIEKFDYQYPDIKTCLTAIKKQKI